MTRDTLQAAISDAERFLKRATVLRGIWELHKTRTKTEPFYLDHTKEQAAVKRASMDLTRTLADLRAGR